MPRISPSCGQVCQSLTVVWNCRPGSAQSQAAVAIRSQISRAFTRSRVLPSVRLTSSHQPSSSTASMKVSVRRSELLEDWPLTVLYASLSQSVVYSSGSKSQMPCSASWITWWTQEAGTSSWSASRTARSSSLFFRGSKLAAPLPLLLSSGAGGRPRGSAGCAGGGSCCPVTMAATLRSSSAFQSM